jgi:hypothetical protein
VPCAAESRKSFGGGVHNCGAYPSVLRVFRQIAGVPAVCLQSAVNHQNAAGVGFAGEIGYRY